MIRPALDLVDGLKTLWDTDADSLGDYCSLIGASDRFLAITMTGKAVLVAANAKKYEKIGAIDLLEGEPELDRDVWSHPALVGNRLYVRSLLAVYCFILE